jgi:hypothetical protein
MVFTKPNTIATINAVAKLSMLTECIRYGKANNAIALIIQVASKRMRSSPMLATNAASQFLNTPFKQN